MANARINYFLFGPTDESYAPERQHESDAGFDLKCWWIEMPDGNYKWDNAIEPGEQVIVHTGIGFDIPFGWYGKIEGRSSFETQGILSVGGVIDSGYQGEVKVSLINTTKWVFGIRPGDRIAQIIFMPCYTGTMNLVEVKDLPKTLRGEGGFGSTGT